jgi:hypothetical protein
MLTGDLNIVDVEWIIQFRIADPYKWLFGVQERDKTIRDISQSVLNELVGDRAIFDVIGSERANIETQAQDMMNRLFDKYNLGIRVTTVKLQNIVFMERSGRLRGREQGHPGQEPADQRGSGSLQQRHPQGQGRGRPDDRRGPGLRGGARQQGPR